MGFLSKIFKNKQIVTIVALIICFVILIVAYKFRVDKAIHAVSVPIAKMDLMPRQKIDETCFETKKVAQSMLSSNVIMNKSELLGDGDTIPAKYVNYNTFIPEGSLFYRSAVTTWDQMPDSAWADLPDGHTMFSLNVSSADTYGNSIYPGQVIDLWYYNSDSNEKFVGELVKGIKVLAVKDESGNHIFKKSLDQKNASSLIFDVDNNTFLYLYAASKIPGGKIVPVPKSSEYTQEGAKPRETGRIRQFITNNIKILQEDETKQTNNVTPSVTD